MKPKECRTCKKKAIKYDYFAKSYQKQCSNCGSQDPEIQTVFEGVG